MNSTSISQSDRPNSLTPAPKPPDVRPSPQKQFLQNWWLVLPIATLFIVVDWGYFNAQQAPQTSFPAREGVTETLPTFAASSLELDLALAQREALQKKYQATLEQLQANQDQQAELQTAYQDLSDRLVSLKRQNQQLLPLAASRAPLLAQIQQMQQVNEKLENQVRNQKQQLTTLENRLNELENHKQKLMESDRQHQLVAKELNALKPELEQARRTIEQLSSQLHKKPEQMVTINVNGQQFLVSQELAAALKTEQK